MTNTSRFEVNVYCDESCHLENDGINVMALGAIWVKRASIKQINSDIAAIKHKHGIHASSEIKWSKISDQKLPVYIDVIEYFFNNDNLHFRGLLVPNKRVLDHKKYSQSHVDWYYKMYFNLLKFVISPNNTHQIYIDILDTNASERADKLHEVLSNNNYDFERTIVKRIQPIQSHEVQIMQLVDIITGALTYNLRLESETNLTSKAKKTLIDKIKTLSGYSLNKTTLFKEDKFSLLVWISDENK